MADFWQFPTVSMGLGPLMAIYQARFLKYLEGRSLRSRATARSGRSSVTARCDEPESLGAIALAGRERLDNLIFVINCNLQRLDGPVRGNGKIIQELESVFRLAGVNIIRAIGGMAGSIFLAKETGEPAAPKRDGGMRRRPVSGLQEQERCVCARALLQIRPS